MPEDEKTETGLPPVSDSVPQMGNAFTRTLGRLLLRCVGWRIQGALPPNPRAVFAAAPHTSNWDFILAMFVILALGVRVSFLMKKEAFFWPFASLFKSLGGVPLDRSATGGVVEQAVEEFAKRKSFWLVITPEGTRSRVARWKTGFLRVAYDSGVPVILVAWDYPSRTFHIDRVWQATSDHSADAEILREQVNNQYRARHPERQ